MSSFLGLSVRGAIRPPSWGPPSDYFLLFREVRWLLEHKQASTITTHTQKRAQVPASKLLGYQFQLPQPPLRSQGFNCIRDSLETAESVTVRWHLAGEWEHRVPKWVDIPWIPCQETPSGRQPGHRRQRGSRLVGGYGAGGVGGTGRRRWKKTAEDSDLCPKLLGRWKGFPGSHMIWCLSGKEVSSCSGKNCQGRGVEEGDAECGCRNRIPGA